MSFKLNRYQEEAVTPELGGIFGDFKLKIKMLDIVGKQENLQKFAKQVKGEDGKPTLEPDITAYASSQTALAISLVCGWENADTQYSTANRDKLIPKVLDDLTEHVLAEDKEPASLKDYILWFAQEKKHFLAV